MKRLKYLIAVPVLIFSLIVLLVNLAFWFWEPVFIFKPKIYPQGNWHPSGLTPAEVWISTEDGKKINGWYFPQPHPKAIILYFHGNQGNITDRYTELLKLHLTCQASVLIFDYRGFGKSGGEPDEANMIKDAESARSWLANKEKVDPRELILLGRSIGTGVAVNLASRLGAKGLILISPFSSLSAAVTYHYPFIAAGLIMHNQFDSIDKIKNYHGPLLIIHGALDQTIPPQQGLELFDKALGPKWFFQVPGGGHFDPIPDKVYQEIKKFIDCFDQKHKKNGDGSL